MGMFCGINRLEIPFQYRLTYEKIVVCLRALYSYDFLMHKIDQE